MYKPTKPTRTWTDIARDDALAGKYRPPQHPASLRANYQFVWEEHADDAAWRARVEG